MFMQTFWSTLTLWGRKSGPESGEYPKKEVGMESLWWILKILKTIVSKTEVYIIQKHCFMKNIYMYIIFLSNSVFLSLIVTLKVFDEP